MAFLIGIVVVLVGVSAFLYGQNKGLEKNGAATTKYSLDTSLNISPSVQPENFTPSPIQKDAVVVIEAEGAYPVQDVNELRARVINPYLDYNNDTRPGEVVSLTISQNLQPSKNTYPYLANAVFSNGGHEGFLISKSSGHIDFWHPECMGECIFTESFVAKYPEIVK